MSGRPLHMQGRNPVPIQSEQSVVSTYMEAAIDAAAREVNLLVWTCMQGSHEPDQYDECEDCRSACQLLAGALIAKALPHLREMISLEIQEQGRILAAKRWPDPDKYTVDTRITPYLAGIGIAARIAERGEL